MILYKIKLIDLDTSSTIETTMTRKPKKMFTSEPHATVPKSTLKSSNMVSLQSVNLVKQNQLKRNFAPSIHKSGNEIFSCTYY